jgi:hypothetical protein
MAYDDLNAVQARARLAGFLFLAVNAVYIAALLGSMAGPEEIRRPAVALGACASAATIALAWSLYELVKPAGPGLALMALLFRVAEAALFGLFAIFSLVMLGGAGSGVDEAGRALARSAQLASGQVGTIYFCPGSALFFYLLLKGRFIPRALAAFGLVATILFFASALAQIGAPAFAAYLRAFDPVFLLAETLTGVWLLVAGAGRRHMLMAEAASPAR